MIISVIIGIATIVWCMYMFDPDGLLDGIAYLFLSIVFGGLVFLICFVIAIKIGEQIPSDYELQRSEKIVALKDSRATHGSFFLGSGSVDGELHYYYATDTSQGYRIKHVDADDCYLLFDNDKPRVEYYKVKRFEKKWHYIYAVPSGHYYNIYVPNGSVDTGFRINLK